MVSRKELKRKQDAGNGEENVNYNTIGAYLRTTVKIHLFIPCQPEVNRGMYICIYSIATCDYLHKCGSYVDV